MLTRIVMQPLTSSIRLKDIYLDFLTYSGTQSGISPSWRLIFRNFVKVSDICFFFASFFLADYFVPPTPLSARPYLVAGFIGALLAFLCMLQSRIYTRRSLRSFITQAPAILIGLLVGAVSQSVVLWLLQTDSATQILSWSFVWLLASAFLIIGFRIPLARYVRHAIGSGLLARRLAVVGANERGHEIAKHIASDKEEANHLVGVFDNASQLSNYQHPTAGHIRAGTITDLVVLSRRERIDAIIIALPLSSIHEIDALRADFSCVVTDVYLLPDGVGYIPSSHAADPDAALAMSLGGGAVISLMRRPLTAYQSLQKALFDFAIAGVLVVILAPLLLAIVVAIKLDSPGPVLFRQPRMGFNNVPFTVFKFRSMYHHMTDLMADRQTSRDDPRVTRVGRLLRKLSFDELPQLLNVLCGTMSLVGPRPHAPSTKAGGYLLDDAVPGYADRHRIKPGITGWAQVNGARGEIQSIDQIEQRVQFDLHYIKNWSLLLDIKILFLTLKREIISSRAF